MMLKRFFIVIYLLFSPLSLAKWLYLQAEHDVLPFATAKYQLNGWQIYQLSPNQYAQADQWLVSSDTPYWWSSEYSAVAQNNDEYFDEQWSLVAHNLPNLWSQQNCENTVLVILDSGIDFNHQDLQSQLFTHELEIANDGVDNDNNGWVDDVHGISFVPVNPDRQSIESIAGYNCPASADFDSNLAKSCGDPWDDGDDVFNFYIGGHGTHVAGIAAGAHNTVGIQGSCAQGKILPIRFLDKNSRGDLADALIALDYVNQLAQLPQYEHLTFIVNNSWVDNENPPLLQTLAAQAKQIGVYWINAAGNQGEDLAQSPKYPATLSFDYANVYSIGNLTLQLEAHELSNYSQRYVSLMMAGSNIYSTYPGWLSKTEVPEGNYQSFSGTSMASPLFAGILAHADFAKSSEEIRAQIANSMAVNNSLWQLAQSAGLFDAGLYAQQLDLITAPTATRFRWLDQSRIELYGYQLNQISQITFADQAVNFELSGDRLIVDLSAVKQSGFLYLDDTLFDFIGLPVPDVENFTVQYDRATQQFIFSWSALQHLDIEIEQCNSSGGYKSVLITKAENATASVSANDNFCKTFRARFSEQVQVGEYHSEQLGSFSALVAADMPLPQWQTTKLASVQPNEKFSRKLDLHYEYASQFYPCQQFLPDCTPLDASVSISNDGWLTGSLGNEGLNNLNLVLLTQNADQLQMTMPLYVLNHAPTLQLSSQFALRYQSSHTLLDFSLGQNAQGEEYVRLIIRPETELANLSFSLLGDYRLGDLHFVDAQGELHEVANVQLSHSAMQFYLEDQSAVDWQSETGVIEVRLLTTLTAAESQDSRCFIATSLWGLNDDATDWYRLQRDNHLNSSFIGRKAIKLYYQLSPRLIQTWLSDEQNKQLVSTMLLSFKWLVEHFVYFALLLWLAILWRLFKPHSH